MKRVGVIIFFLLLIAAATGGIFFFDQNQNIARNLAKTEKRLNVVKMAFEERGRLLEGLKIKSDIARDLSMKMAGDLDKAKVDLESYQASKSKMASLVADRRALDGRLLEVQNQLAASQKTTETNKALAQEKLEELQQKLTDAKSLDDQLRQANDKIKKLNMDFSAAEAELKSQKQLLKDWKATIKGFEDLGLSPAQIRGLQAENSRLKTIVPVRSDHSVPESIGKKKPSQTLKTLPLGLKLPLADKSLTKPLKSDTTPKPAQP